MNYEVFSEHKCFMFDLINTAQTILMLQIFERTHEPLYIANKLFKLHTSIFDDYDQFV